ncbi:MAG: hypothetical protein NW241_01550 [Bacteroidia bacterium]|nr:hypothetical protein [Bacteroidia bacterium]
MAPVRPLAFANVLSRAIAALLLLHAAVPASAQSCTVYERELQAWFMQLKQDQVPDIQALTRTFERCAQPTPRMELIYYYARALAAFQAQDRQPQDRYRDAVYYYDRAATHFSSLVRTAGPDAQFVELYFQRAESLEAVLQDEAYRLRMPRENRSYGMAADADGWSKHSYTSDTYLPTAPQAHMRGQSAQETYTRTSILTGKPASELPQGSTYRSGEQPERLFVGQIGEINIFEYLHWNRVQQDAAQAEQGLGEPADPAMQVTRGLSPAPVAAVARPLTTDAPYISLYDGLQLTLQPGPGSPARGTAAFGEALTLLSASSTTQNGRTYVQARTRQGVIGWTELAGLAREGQPAAVTASFRALPQPSQRQDRGAVQFLPGELVVLLDAQGEWVQLAGRNAEKQGWVFGIDYFSIEPLDLKLASAMHQASLAPSVSGRLSQLYALRNLAGYQTAELAPAVEQQIAALQGGAR